MKALFRHQVPKGITIQTSVADKRSDCLQILEGQSDYIKLLVFSYDSTWLVSAAYDKMVKIWEMSSDRCLQTGNVRTTTHNVSFDAGRNLRPRTEVGML